MVLSFFLLKFQVNDSYQASFGIKKYSVSNLNLCLITHKNVEIKIDVESQKTQNALQFCEMY